MTEKELIRRVRAGDKAALGEIASTYYDDIYRFCFYLCGNENDAYDITQDVFLRFIRYAGSYRDKNLKGYLLVIARNLCRNYFRQAERRKMECGAAEDFVEAGETNGDKGSAYEEVERRHDLKDILLRIPEEQREVIVLRIYGEMKFGDIAKAVGSNLSTVKSRYRLGMEALRKELVDYGD